MASILRLAKALNPVNTRYAVIRAASPPQPDHWVAAVCRSTGQTGSVWGVPSRYTTDSNTGVVAYVLLGTVKGCGFADAEAERGSRVYIKTRDLGRLTKFTSELICQKRISSWASWGGRQITHLRFFDESEPTLVGEYVYKHCARSVRASRRDCPRPTGDAERLPTRTASQSALRVRRPGNRPQRDASADAAAYTVYYDDFFDSSCRS